MSLRLGYSSSFRRCLLHSCFCSSRLYSAGFCSGGFRSGSFLNHFFFHRRAGKDHHRERCHRNLDGIRPLVLLCLFRALRARIGAPFAAIAFRVTVGDLFIFSCKRNANPEFLMQYCIEVADNQKCLFLLFRPSQEYHNTFFRIRTVHPLKAFGLIIHLVQRRTVYINLI